MLTPAGAASVAVFSFLVFLGYFFFFNFLAAEQIAGHSQLGVTSSYLLPAISACGTLLGVLSKTLYEYATNDKAKSPWKGIIASLLVSPLVIMYTYSALSSVQDLFLCFLIAFQNGFFFRIIVSAAEQSVRVKASK